MYAFELSEKGIDFTMKLEQKEQPLLFSETVLPDIFFAEYLPELSGNCLKLYLYMNFLSKYNKTVKLNDLSKKLALPLKVISESISILEEKGLILKKSSGYIVVNLQEVTLNRLYSLNLTASEDKIKSAAKSSSRSKAIEHINNMYFQGVMSPSWYNDIDIWFNTYNFDDQVMIALFDYCFNRSALHRNYVKTVAEAWGNNKIRTWSDLDLYYQKQEKIMKIKKSIAKKLGKRNGLTQFEEAYIEKWVFDYGYDMDIIEIALKRTTFKQAPTFEYINNLITDWHDRKFTKPEQVLVFIEQRRKQFKNAKELKQSTSKSNYSQRNYDNLDFLYANNTKANNN